MTKAKQHTIPLERLKEHLVFCAMLVDTVGPAAKPWLDRIEREYLAASEKGKEAERIRKMLAG